MATEKEKMLSREAYYLSDTVLVKDRNRAKVLKVQNRLKSVMTYGLAVM